MMKRTAVAKSLAIAGSALMLGLIAAPAYADEGDDGGKGHKAPEASLVLLLPAAGGAALGIRLLLANRRRS